MSAARRLALFLALVATIAACSVPATGHEERAAVAFDAEAYCATGRWLDDHRTAMAKALATSTEGRSLLVAALQRDWIDAGLDRCVDPKPSTDELFARAIAAAPEDLLVLYIAAAQGCEKEAAACAGDAVIQRLQALDPDNARTWLLAYSMHRRRGDAEATRDALARAARAADFNDHSADLLREYLARSLATDVTFAVPSGKPLQWDPRTHVRFFHWSDAQSTSVLATGPVDGLVATCDPEGAARDDDALQADCHAIGLRLADGNGSWVSHMHGVFLAYLTSRDPAERAVLERRSRSMQWLQTQAQKKDSADVRKADAAWVEARIAATLATPGDLEGLRATVEAAGLPLVPPTDWQPSRTLAKRVEAMRGTAAK